MQKPYRLLSAALLLIFILPTVAVLWRLIPSYIAYPEIPSGLYWLAAALFLVVTGPKLQLLRRNVSNQQPDREITRKEVIWNVVLIAIFYAFFIPATVIGAGPAVLSMFWYEPKTLTLPIKDATKLAGRLSCEGRVDLDGLLFLSTICGVPEELRSQMKPGDNLELTGQGHSMGLRVEEVRLIPKE